MRRLLIWLPFVLLTLQPALAQEVDRGTQYQAVGFNYGNSSVGYSIFEGDLADTPSWYPEQGEPPVALNEALGIARNNLRRFVREADSLVVWKVGLVRFASDKWVYEVLFNGGDKDGSDAAFWIFVKMDGTVIEPTFTDKSAAPKKSGGEP